MQENSAQRRNAERAAQVATGLYPNEKWELLENGIYISKSRMQRSAEQIKILEKELRQARILTERGHTVYLLPEFGPRKTKHPDAIVDGLIMEFKTVSGNERKIKEKFKQARGKADNVFLQIEPPFTHRTVARKLAGAIRGKGYNTGLIWVYFKHSGKMAYWSVEGLK